MEFKLEICVDNVQSAIDAGRAGASRVELCACLSAGGMTPSFGTISSARINTDIGLHVLIRPRAGDFLYSPAEYDIMRRDIDFCGERGADGIVTGILRPDGRIDVERTARLVELANPMAVTFHRAFDLCIDPGRGLEDVILTGATRLLTSGQKNSAEEGLETICRLVSLAGQRIIIMPGSGLNETNVAEIASRSGASEFHLSAGKSLESGMIFRMKGVNMGSTAGYDEFSVRVADPLKIERIIKILKTI
jgi:copper homeostasis protein